MEQLNNELKVKLIMSGNPLSSSCGNLAQLNQLNRQSQLKMSQLSQLNQMNQLNNVQYIANQLNRRQSVNQNWQTASKMRGNVANSPQPSYANLQNMQQLENLQHSLQHMQNAAQQQLLNPYLQRRNRSLTDINSTNVQLLANSFLPYAGAFDLNSLSQSMDEMPVDDESYSDENCSSNSSKHRQFNKKANGKQSKRSSSRGSSINKNALNEKLIRRSHSSAHLINPMQLNAYDCVQQQNQLLANLYYAQPILNATSIISPASSIRSLEPVKRKSSVSSMLSNRTLMNNDFDGLENAYTHASKRSSKYRRSGDPTSSSNRRSKSLCRSKSQSSNRSSRSFKSSNYDRANYDKSNRCMSSDSCADEESDYSESCSVESYSNADDSTPSELDEKRRKYNQSKKQWKCKYCTFVNRLQMNICEMCSKSNPQVLNGQKESNSTGKHSKSSGSGGKTKHRTKANESNNDAGRSDQRKSNYIEFTDELVKQQEEVEKELLRRIANEKLVEEENLRLEQQALNDKSRSAKNSCKNELEFKEETNDLIKLKTNSSSPGTSTTSSLNNSNNQTISSINRNVAVVSKIKPPSISLKQQTNSPSNQLNWSTNKLNSTNSKLIKSQSLDSSSKKVNNDSTTADGRHREEKYTQKQSGIGTRSNVQQSTDQQYNQRYTKQNKSEEQPKCTTNILVEQPVKESYDKKVLDGMQMFKLLREAERRDFLADELEIALSFNVNDPIGWLVDNWSSMKETVLTLANNQLVTFCQEKNATLSSTVNDEDARTALRSTKGNIWQAVDRCVNSKKTELKESQQQSRIPIYTPDKHHDVKSFTFNLRSLGQGSSNRDGNVHLREDKVLSNNQLNQMESLLDDWYESNLKIQRKSNSPSQPNTSEKVRNLIAFLKQNGFFDTNKLSQDEIDDQMKTLMNLLEKKLKETQETNQTGETGDRVKNNLIDLNQSNNSSTTVESSRIDQEFDEIDEKMKQSLNFLEEIEQKTQQKADDRKDAENVEKKRTNFRNLKITSRVSIDDDSLDNEFQDASDKLISEPVHNINIKLEQSPVAEATLNCNLKKEKGKIKIIKRKIYRNSSSEQAKSFEKVTYVNNIEEADLINLDDEIHLDDLSGKTESEANKDKRTVNGLGDTNDDQKQVNSNNNQLLIDDDVEKQLNQMNPNFGYARTIYECGICCSKHHINELISMLFCEHRACKNCLEKYFTIQIREKQRVLISCPFCDQPEIQSDDENAVHEYLTLLQELVKNIVSKDLYELFQRKVRDRTLQKEPGFRWCVNCCSGFLANNIEGNVLRCPDCKSLSCSKCGELWKEEHRVLSCEQFKQFLMHGSEWMAEHKLTVHLNEFGIICPKCKFRYELSKGGCLHFKCVQCEHEFCYGCDASFRTGDKCSIYGKSCEKLGFHAHHPRNCLFYLRDKKTEDLEKLLNANNIDYEIKEFDTSKEECDVMEQKESESGLKDEPCQRAIEKYGICSLHYIEHLAKLIKRNHIDPITIFDDAELVSVLRREQIDVPKKTDFKNYKSKLIETIEKHSPLI